MRQRNSVSRWKPAVLTGTAWLMAGGVLGMPLSARAQAGNGGLLQNGDFRRGADGWKAELRLGAASASLEWPESAAPPPGVTGKVARFTVKRAGTANWHAQFYQSGLEMKEGETYAVSFWGRAEAERPLSLHVIVDTGGARFVGLNTRVRLRPAWSKFTLTFTAKRPVPPPLPAADIAATVPVTFQVAPDGSPNTATLAGSFNGWNINITPLTRAGEGSGLWQTVVRLVPGTYQYKFVLNGDRWITDPNAKTIGDGNGNTNSVLDVPAPVDKGRLVFALGDAAGTVELTGVSLENAARPPATLPAKETPPASPQKKPETSAPPAAPHPLVGVWESRPDAKSQRYRFTFNADGTGSLRFIRGNVPVDVPSAPVGEIFRWHQGKGKEVVIGTKTYAWRLESEGSARILHLTGKDGKTRALVRR